MLPVFKLFAVSKKKKKTANGNQNGPLQKLSQSFVKNYENADVKSVNVSVTANVIGQAFLAWLFVLATVKSIEHMKHHDVDRMPEIRVAMKKMNKHQNYTFE